MHGKISNVFHAIGSSLFSSTGSAVQIMFWNSAGTRARASRHTMVFWKFYAMRGRGQRCSRIARETASAMMRCCSNLA